MSYPGSFLVIWLFIFSMVIVEITTLSHKLSLNEAFAIPCAIVEWALRMLSGKNWLMVFHFATSFVIVSRLAAMVMDLTWSVDFTKFLIKTFVHTSSLIGMN